MRFLFVDRILELVPAEVIRGIKHITRDDHYLCSDGQGRDYFMPSLIGETLGQLAAWNVMQTNHFTQRPVAGVVSSACLHRPAYVGETLWLETFIDVLDDAAVQYHGVAKIGDETVFSIDGALGPLLPMNDFINPDVVRQQFTEIYRPVDNAALQFHTANLLESTPNPHEKPAMCFDRIVASEAGVSLCAEKRVTRAAPYFADHFPNKPVLPMTVLLECKLNLARKFIALSPLDQSYTIQELRKIKMNVFVLPGDVLFTYVTVKSHDANALVLNFRTEVDGKRVCVLDMVLTVKGHE